MANIKVVNAPSGYNDPLFEIEKTLGHIDKYRSSLDAPVSLTYKVKGVSSS
jgi:hypothetical protein